MMQRRDAKGKKDTGETYAIRTDASDQPKIVLPPISLLPFGRSPLLQFSLVVKRNDSAESKQPEEQINQTLLRG